MKVILAYGNVAILLQALHPKTLKLFDCECVLRKKAPCEQIVDDLIAEPWRLPASSLPLGAKWRHFLPFQTQRRSILSCAGVHPVELLAGLSNDHHLVAEQPIECVLVASQFAVELKRACNCLVLLDDTSFKSSHNCFGPVRHLVSVQEHHARDGLLTLQRQIFVSFEELFDIFWSEPAVDVCHGVDSRADARARRPTASTERAVWRMTPPACAARAEWFRENDLGRRNGQALPINGRC